MVIKVLVEDTSIADELRSEHGFSLYIETDSHKILFDTGQRSLFVENASKMDIDLSGVDIAVVSHGHYDHGGGLKTFMNINKSAKIYISRKGFGEYYSAGADGRKRYIGLDTALAEDERFIFTGDEFVIDEELELFSGVKGTKIIPSGNNYLFRKERQEFLQDEFDHEQNLIIKEDGKRVLVAGCAHKGIINIIDHMREKKGVLPSDVIGGFHMYNSSTKRSENPEVVAEIASYLKSTGSMYHTGHCTGKESYNSMRAVICGNIDYLATGSKIII